MGSLRRGRARAASGILLAAGLVIALIGAALSWSAWTAYQDAETAAATARANLDAELVQARSMADQVIVAQAEVEELRAFAKAQDDCLIVSPWSPLCNNWQAGFVLAAAEEDLAALEVELDAAFARTEAADIPYEAARATADDALARFTITWAVFAAVALALIAAAVVVHSRSVRSARSTSFPSDAETAAQPDAEGAASPDAEAAAQHASDHPEAAAEARGQHPTARSTPVG